MNFRPMSVKNKDMSCIPLFPDALTCPYIIFSFLYGTGALIVVFCKSLYDFLHGIQ